MKKDILNIIEEDYPFLLKKKQNSKLPDMIVYIFCSIVVAYFILGALNTNFGTTKYIPEAEASTLNQRTVILTAYNTVKEQTDSTPCISASGDNICGRNDVVANNCDKFGTKITLLGKEYTVLDRKNSRYGCEWYDISFDKDIQGAKDFGVKELTILIK